MDTDLLFIIGVMSDIVHSLVLVMNRPSPFPGLSYIDYEFIFLYICTYTYGYSKKPKKTSELPWRDPFLQFHCKVVTGPVSHHCSIWPWSDLNLEFIYSAIKLPPC